MSCIFLKRIRASSNAGLLRVVPEAYNGFRKPQLTALVRQPESKLARYFPLRALLTFVVNLKNII